VVFFDLAVNRSYKGKDGNWQEETLFIRINYWGKQAEQLIEHLTKGKEIFVDGYLRSRSWTTQDGQKRTVLEVTAQTVTPLERVSRGASADGSYNSSASVDSPPPGDSGDDVPF
jgi:single-strand DNA-binding protein